MPILQYRSTQFTPAQAIEGARLLAALTSRIDVFYGTEDGECALQVRVSEELFANLSAWCADEEDCEPEPVEDDARDLPLPDDVPRVRRLVDETPGAALLAAPLPDCGLALVRVGGACPAFARGLCARVACPAAALAAPEPEPEPGPAKVIPLRPRRPVPLSRRLGQIAAVLAVVLFQPGVAMKAGTLDINGNGVLDVEDVAGLFGLDVFVTPVVAGATYAPIAGVPWQPGRHIRRFVTVGAETLDMEFELGARGHLIALREHRLGQAIPPRPPVAMASGCGVCDAGVFRRVGERIDTLHASY